MTAQPTRDQLRALAKRATPGPWETFKTSRGRDNGIGSVSPTVPADEAVMEDIWSDPADAALIVAARNALPALLDALDQAEARIQAARELHYHDVFRGHLDNGCAICGHEWPCPTIRALDG